MTEQIAGQMPPGEPAGLDLRLPLLSLSRPGGSHAVPTQRRSRPSSHRNEPGRAKTRAGLPAAPTRMSDELGCLTEHVFEAASAPEGVDETVPDETTVPHFDRGAAVAARDPARR